MEAKRSSGVPGTAAWKRSAPAGEVDGADVRGADEREGGHVRDGREVHHGGGVVDLHQESRLAPGSGARAVQCDGSDHIMPCNDVRAEHISKAALADTSETYLFL